MDYSINKKLYGYVLSLIKAIPIIMMGLSLLSVVLSYSGVDSTIVSYIGGISLLFLLFMYLSSIAFGFSASHRWFIYYCAILWVICGIDENIGIPLSDKGMLLLFLIIAGITLIAVILSKNKESYVSKFKQTYIRQEVRHQKKWYKIELIIIKTIPLITAVIAMLNTFLSFFGIDWTIWSYIGGTSLLMILFMYLTSIVFRFCAYHRIFIHYLALIWTINTIDWITYTLNLYTILDEGKSGRNVMLLFVLFTGSTMIIAIYLKLKSLKVKK